MCEDNIIGNKLTKCQTPEPKSAKEDWNDFRKGYTEKIIKYYNENKHLPDIICSDCEKPVKNKTYVQHRTVSGCSKINPLIRFKNWKRTHK